MSYRTPSPRQDISYQSQDLGSMASWQEIGAYYPTSSAQSMSTPKYLHDHVLLPRALSAFPVARQSAPSEKSEPLSSGRPSSSGARLQVLKRRQQVG